MLYFAVNDLPPFATRVINLQAIIAYRSIPKKIDLDNKEIYLLPEPDIPQSSIFTSGPLDLFVPANAPDNVFVRLEINDIYYHLGQTDEVKMSGTQTSHQVSLQDTSYYGELISTLPEVSKGDEDIIITGRAIDRSTSEPLFDVPLNLIITVNGFERKFIVTTDETGQFTHTFEPLENEAGVYHVHAVHGSEYESVGRQLCQRVRQP
ncbi:MAG: hypothetical protein K8S13_19755 [Desulfobacula sp.]|uniref:hypothetical protein n=1 Tax=Desulfobacula sp. TaxID=2593537 RepID=UPI0025BF0D07|nr:hypothetical protein [Desulfobacula sp.]MCD4722074.1 hypothetical protein [Desulfobacula sp.]